MPALFYFLCMSFFPLPPQDIRTMEHIDQMDSFVLAETFKYLYLLFTEPSELPLDMEKYILSTE
ncbi:unnamed protein product, partial [Dibothriocephalus latus]